VHLFIDTGEEKENFLYRYCSIALLIIQMRFTLFNFSPLFFGSFTTDKATNRWEIKKLIQLLVNDPQNKRQTNERTKTV
jgi:hypothetical protein